MLRFLPGPIKVIINFTWAALATAIIGLLIIVVGIFKLLLPIPPIKRLTSSIANGLFRLWAYSVSGLFSLTHKTEWVIEGDLPDNRNGWYMILCNHLSWVDIPLLMHLSRKQLPMPRFFLKQELFWVPVIGLGCWVLDMPFMKRYSREQIAKKPELKGKDIETTREKCEKFRDIPTTIINFCEGTRLTPEKHKRKQSEFQNLLPPKAGGTSFTLQAMGEQFQEILDVTVVYPGIQPGESVVYPLLSGKLKKIYVHIDRIPVTPDLRGDYFNDEAFRGHFQAWLNERWKKKDQRISQYRSDHE
ncbi:MULTISPECIES: acyltransferase [Gammaproteobacteria]|uniref:acyltransferase n=1 Tax=Gammaproteobacteria TaxID=1236 RepID=UPI000DCFA725|nr:MULTISPECIES: acyltransferase [Gammaproteobacteria]RTE86764.1 acyltransferase [Aliidiomarina sp. B3213]TCZ90682.1 acyltransferase [Lysobacter sp. N42]